jgi:SWI/SNF-related matrix-associated actin-dependent regulator of chromatin subfamily A member 5
MLYMQLRKVCNHPFLFDEADPEPGFTTESIVEAAGKMQVMDRLLLKLYEAGHRVVIFSQFTKVLDIISDYLSYRGFQHCRLDGSTNRVQRQVNINSFNAANSPIFAFIMSTRAGGLGVNLQTADTVILYDRCGPLPSL